MILRVGGKFIILSLSFGCNKQVAAGHFLTSHHFGAVRSLIEISRSLGFLAFLHLQNFTWNPKALRFGVDDVQECLILSVVTKYQPGHLSNEKSPGCLGCIGNYITLCFKGILISQYKDPYKPTSMMESRRVPLQPKSSPQNWGHLQWPSVLIAWCAVFRNTKKTMAVFWTYEKTHTPKKTQKNRQNKEFPAPQKKLEYTFSFGLRCGCSLIYLKIIFCPYVMCSPNTSYVSLC